MSRDHLLMERHLEALYTHDAAGRLVRVREHDGPPAPRLYIGRTAGAQICRCRHDVDDALCRALQEAAALDPVDFEAEVRSDGRATDAARYIDLLSRAAPVTTVWSGPAFRFPPEPVEPTARGGAARTGSIVLLTNENAEVLQPLLSAWTPDVQRSAPLMAFVAGGKAVAVCGSVRITALAHEAGVETAAPFRGQGHGARVVAAWARAVRSLGAEPLYSTDWRNAASRALARTLGLVLYGTDLSIS